MVTIYISQNCSQQPSPHKLPCSDNCPTKRTPWKGKLTHSRGNLSEHRTTNRRSGGMGGMLREVLLCLPAIRRWLSGFIGRWPGVVCSFAADGLSKATASRLIALQSEGPMPAIQQWLERRIHQLPRAFPSRIRRAQPTGSTTSLQRHTL